MFLSVDRFVQGKVPEIVRAKQELHALFISYHQIFGHPTGPVDTGDDRLKIRVEAGMLEYYSIESLRQCISSSPMLMQHEALTSLEDVGRRIDPAFTSDAPDLVVVYVGFVAFPQALAMVRALRQRIPHAVIVTLTCDCDETAKKVQLMPAVLSGEIDYPLITDACGGSGPMASIIEGLITSWRKRA